MWAEQNTRESILDALKRRETFATSGKRIRVRLFAGWNYPNGLDKGQGLVQAVYKGGVPMGGELHGAQGKASKLVCHVGAASCRNCLRDRQSSKTKRFCGIKTGKHHSDATDF